MGNLARDLESAFKLGYENFEEDMPSLAQGRLGRAEDKKLIRSATPFEKALTYYHLRQKANSKNKRFYQDFFPTPEPLAFKMVEWAKSKYAKVWMDPSCGDGAIARFFPENSKRIGIDVDQKLLSLCKLKANIDIKHMDFMEYKINNKADRIIMNPPFGHGGKTAVEHLLKALIHLDKNGWSKLYCILPCGPTADKHFERMEESGNMKFFNYTGQILLPSCTFSKANTKVMTRIVRFDGVGYDVPFKTLDLTYCSNMDELFSNIKNLNF
jgi:predicted RNA methylase